MTDTETIKQAIAQAIFETVKTTIVTVNEENRRQGMGAGHKNTKEIIRP